MQPYPIRPPQGQTARPPPGPIPYGQPRPPYTTPAVARPRPLPSPANTMQNQFEAMSISPNSVGSPGSTPGHGHKGHRAKRVFHPDGSGMGAVRPPVGTVDSSPQVPAVRHPMVQPPMQQPAPAQHQPQPQPLPQQPKSRIDPNQIPSPIQVQEQDQQMFAAQDYGTCSKGAIPLSTTQVRVIDQDTLLEQSHLPMALVVQPLATLRPDEEAIPVIEMQKEGPVRCRRCKGYLNPWCVFTDGGRKFVCNLCGFDSDVPDEYFCNLDISGRRTDYEYRPELRNGTIEYIVPEDYWSKKPQPIHYLFAVDVSLNAVQSGMLASFCQGLSSILYDDDAANRLPEGAKIGLVTFDRSMHFYNLKPTLEQAQLMVVSDVHDVFVPLHEGLFVDPEESRAIISDLLSNLPNFYAENRAVEAVLGTVVSGALSAMKECGGKLVVFQSVLPTKGPGSLRVREHGKRTAEEEMTLLTAQNDSYHKWATDLVNAGICADLWFFPLRAHVELATIGQLSSITGGDTHYMPNFNYTRDSAKLAFDLRHSLTRQTGYNGVLRVRCSNGLTIHEQFGNFHMKNNTDIELAGIDEDKAISFMVKHDDKLDPKMDASFQCAMLYTTATGERRVRVINLSLPVTDNIGSLFRNSQMDVTINVLMKQAITMAGSKSTQQLRDELTDKCVKILTAYRKHCAYSSSPGQLILPDSFKLFPLYTLGMLKSTALKSCANLDIDTRVHHMRRIKSLGILELMVLLYPRLIPIGHLHEYPALPNIDSPESVQIRKIIGAIQSQRAWNMPVRIVRQQLDMELDFANLLAEDKNNDQMSYVDFLCVVHRQIQNEITQEKQDSIMASASYWSHRY
ncbi:COPII coat Sec23p-Sfb3p heterodimer component [Umbelopsis nana]